jgi:hypothetical protein
LEDLEEEKEEYESDKVTGRGNASRTGCTIGCVT